MPSPIIHLDILFRLVSELEISLTEELMVGILSPDAIHIRANQTWADKAVTHFYDEADQSYEMALQAASMTLDSLPNDFALGYLWHLLTDYLWREKIYTPFFREYKEKLPRQELYTLYYREMNRLDGLVLAEANWIPFARQLLSRSCSINHFSLLTHDEIDKWCQKVIQQDLQIKQDSSLGELEVFKKQDLMKFINTTLQDLTGYYLQVKKMPTAP